MPGEVRVTYNGTLEPAEVRTTFASHDLFLFPTLGENFGHVIAESLSASCPVLCSDQTPWTEVLESGGGIVLRSAAVAEMTAAMQSVINMSDGGRNRMRSRAGDAYLEWHHRASNENILDRMAMSRRSPYVSECL
jgi:glycosyltransferase involved in cell wall biosynthesis